jgi:NitT/TauT family transport system substrate-binding protein/putative hydroxymethylpyrimidine transport system substrate-binding protein
MQRARIAASCALALLCALFLLACGGSAHTDPSPSKKPTHVTLVLDFVPNAVHAGIYRALAAGYYRAQGIDLHVVVPGATQAPLSLVDSGRAQFGLADGSDVATQIDRGGDAQAVMAIAQRPLGGLIALRSEGLRSPAQLQGRTVGITGVASVGAGLDTVGRAAGGDPRKVHVVTVGFDGAQALLSGRIAAFTGFVPADGVQLQVQGHPITPFRLDEYGGPGYPGLVAFATQRLIGSDPRLVQAFVTATKQGYEDTVRDPLRSVEDLARLNPGLDRRFTRASLAAYLPLFSERGKVPLGTLQPARIQELSTWMLHNGLIHTPIAPARYSAPTS